MQSRLTSSQNSPLRDAFAPPSISAIRCWPNRTRPAAGKVFEALKAGLWDVAFLAVDPVRAAGIDFTAPYVVIEGVYVVPKDSKLQKVDDVDRTGIRVAVAQGSAYDL